MKTLLFTIIIFVSGYHANSQEQMDSLDVIASNFNSGYSKIYHLKNKNHFSKKAKSSYPEDYSGKVELSPDGNVKMDDAILKSLSKEKLKELSGKRIMFSLKVNSQGHISNVVIMILQKYDNDFNLTKKECQQLIHNVKKDVKFDIASKYSNQNKYISLNVSRKFE